MAENKKKPTIKVTLMQGSKEATFKLTEKEYSHLKSCEMFRNTNRVTNTSAFTWARYYLSPSKSARFSRTFDYYKGDFHFFVED